MSHRAGRSLSPYLMKGYPAVSLHGDGGRKIRRVHSIVAEAFHGPCPEGHQCAHLDGNPRNNSASNLAWVTQAENEAHKRLHGTATVGEKSPHAKLTNERAELIRAAVRRPLSRREVAILAAVSDSMVEGILDLGNYPSSPPNLRLSRR